MALNEFDRGSAQLDRRGAGGESSDLAASRRQRRRRAAAAAWNARASVTGMADVKPSSEVGRSSTGQGEPGCGRSTGLRRPVILALATDLEPARRGVAEGVGGVT